LHTIAADQAESPLILSIDVGSSSLRTLLFDRLGRVIQGSESHWAHQVQTTATGAAEADAAPLLAAVYHCIDDTLGKIGRLASQIEAVASCTFVTNIMGLDRDGRIVVPLSTYADTRATTSVAWLRDRLDEAAAYQRTGCRFHPSYLPARFHWYAQAMPERFARVQRWVSFAEYLQEALFGQMAVTYSVASWTGMLHRQELKWDELLLASLPIQSNQLSPLTDVNLPNYGLRPEFARRWPALSQIPWFPAIGDGAAANIGSGCVQPAQMALTLGTTTAMRAIIEGSVDTIPPGLWCYRVDRRRSLLGGALTEGGNLFAWLRQTLRLDEVAALEKLLATLPADGHGLTVLPFLAGERSPGWVGEALGTIHGLTLASTPLEILQAGLEAVAYRIGQVYELLRQRLADGVQIIASGGALHHSPAWGQIICDVLGRPMDSTSVREASGRGAALLALEAMGALADLGEAPLFLGRRYTPDLARHQRYRQAIARQQKLYQKLGGELTWLD
jgi:gluconokinase